MREHKFIRKCPDGCGKDEYDLGTYRGFHLYQKPFFDGWYIYAEIELCDDLDRLLMRVRATTIHGKIYDETTRSGKPSLEEVENNVIKSINDFWVEKETLIIKAKEGVFKVEPREN